MLAIRMQRTGRKGHAMFRVVVQDARRTPTSGKVVARIGSYDPHAKAVTLDKEKAAFYLEHGAQPSGRVAVILKKEGVKLPDWVKQADKREGSVRNPDKRRSTRPAEPVAEAPAEATEAANEPNKEEAEQAPAATPETEATTPAEEPAVAPEESSTESEAPAEKPAEETSAESETEAESEAEKPTEDTPEAADTESEKPASENKK